MNRDVVLRKLSKPLLNASELLHYLKEAERLNLTKTPAYISKRDKLNQLFNT